MRLRFAGQPWHPCTPTLAAHIDHTKLLGTRKDGKPLLGNEDSTVVSNVNIDFQAGQTNVFAGSRSGIIIEHHIEAARPMVDALLKRGKAQRLIRISDAGIAKVRNRLATLPPDQRKIIQKSGQSTEERLGSRVFK